MKIPLKWIIVAGSVLTLLLFLGQRSYLQSSETETRQLQKKISQLRQQSKKQAYLANAAYSAPPTDAKILEKILIDLAEQNLLYKPAFRLSPQEPITENGITLQRARLDINFYTFLDQYAFNFLEKLKEELPQPLYVKELQLIKKREPDYANINLLENGQLIELLEGRIQLILYFAE